MNISETDFALIGTLKPLVNSIKISLAKLQDFLHLTVLEQDINEDH